MSSWANDSPPTASARLPGASEHYPDKITAGTVKLVPGLETVDVLNQLDEDAIYRSGLRLLVPRGIGGGFTRLLHFEGECERCGVVHFESNAKVFRQFSTFLFLDLDVLFCL